MIKKLSTSKMAKIARRLAAEKAADEGGVRGRGEADGYRAAASFSYSEIKYAAESFLAAPDAKPYSYGMIFDDDFLGEYFREQADIARLSDPELFSVLQDTDERGWAQPRLEAYLDGWIDGVRAFWNDVAPLL